MKLTVSQNQLSLNPSQFLRRAGYGFIHSNATDHDSYVLRLGSGFYPRLHMYLEETEGTITFNLHLDQKQASYAGNHMHNAEYDGEVVEGEIDRLKQLLGLPINYNNQTKSTNPANEANNYQAKPTPIKQATIGSGKLEDYINELPKKEEKKSWWKKLF